MFEYRGRIQGYLNAGYSQREAEREAIMDMYGDEIIAERRKKKYGLREDESDEENELTE